LGAATALGNSRDGRTGAVAVLGSDSELLELEAAAGLGNSRGGGIGEHPRDWEAAGLWELEVAADARWRCGARWQSSGCGSPDGYPLPVWVAGLGDCETRDGWWGGWWVLKSWQVAGVVSCPPTGFPTRCHPYFLCFHCYILSDGQLSSHSI
jgi:hypothetical protein